MRDHFEELSSEVARKFLSQADDVVNLSEDDKSIIVQAVVIKIRELTAFLKGIDKLKSSFEAKMPEFVGSEMHSLLQKKLEGLKLNEVPKVSDKHSNLPDAVFKWQTKTIEQMLAESTQKTMNMLASEPIGAHPLAITTWKHLTKDKMKFFEKSLSIVDPIAILFKPDSEYAEWSKDGTQYYGMRSKKTGRKDGLVRAVNFSIEESCYDNDKPVGLAIRIFPGDFVEVTVTHPCQSVWGHVRFNNEFEVVDGLREGLKSNRLSKLTDLHLAQLKA